MFIRLKEERDVDKIDRFIKVAFETAKVKDGDEHHFVQRLRQSLDYFPQFEYVAECNDEIVGHIMLTRLHFENEQEESKLLLLAPLAVRLDQRNKGVGARLIETAEAAAKDAKEKAIILVGDPAYYNRYGYQQVSEFGLLSEPEIPREYLLIKKIDVSDWLKSDGKILIPS